MLAHADLLLAFTRPAIAGKLLRVDLLRRRKLHRAAMTTVSIRVPLLTVRGSPAKLRSVRWRTDAHLNAGAPWPP